MTDFSIEELYEMCWPKCPECGGKQFARAGDTYVGRCVECKTLVENFGVVPDLASALLKSIKKETSNVFKKLEWKKTGNYSYRAETPWNLIHITELDESLFKLTMPDGSAYFVNDIDQAKGWAEKMYQSSMKKFIE